MLGDRKAMTTEEDQVQWRLAKARQLKELALGTADRTRRKQFLLIATEYQKLAQQDDGGIALGIADRMAIPTNTSTRVGVVTTLRLAPRRPAAADSKVPPRQLSSFLRAFRLPRIADLTIWAILAVISFALLLAPGDQTAQGLQAVFDLLSD